MRMAIAAILIVLSAISGSSHAEKKLGNTGDPLTAVTLAQNHKITRDYMVGEWVTRNVEFGQDVEISWTVRTDGTLAYRFTINGTASDGSTGTWSIDNDVVTERWQRPFGLIGIGTARIEAIDQNTLRLTIINNGHSEYDGMVRVYRRRPGSQVSMNAA